MFKIGDTVRIKRDLSLETYNKENKNCLIEDMLEYAGDYGIVCNAHPEDVYDITGNPYHWPVNCLDLIDLNEEPAGIEERLTLRVKAVEAQLIRIEKRLFKLVELLKDNLNPEE